jgi:hypothetical protein
VPAFIVVLQSDAFDATAGDIHDTGTTARFPLLLGVFPVSPRLAVQVGYGSYLDQHWQVQQADSIDLSTGRVPVTDRFVSSGGIARLQAALAYRVAEKLSLGISGEMLTGAAHDTTVREIGGLVPAVTGVTYTYSGLGGGLGARWQPSTVFSASAAVHAGGRIRAESDSTGVERKDYTNPVRVDAGASAKLTGQALVVASASWQGWSSLNDELASSGGARDAASATAGVEYNGFSLLGKPVPLRLGARYAQLPFRWSGADTDFPSERAVTAGLGLRLGGPAATLAAAAERGWRGGSSAGIDEPYWRFTFSLQVLGR